MGQDKAKRAIPVGREVIGACQFDKRAGNVHERDLFKQQARKHLGARVSCEIKNYKTHSAVKQNPAKPFGGILGIQIWSGQHHGQREHGSQNSTPQRHAKQSAANGAEFLQLHGLKYNARSTAAHDGGECGYAQRNGVQAVVGWRKKPRHNYLRSQPCESAD